MKKNVSLIFSLLITLFQFYIFTILIGTGFNKDIILTMLISIMSLYVCFYIYKK